MNSSTETNETEIVIPDGLYKIEHQGGAVENLRFVGNQYIRRTCLVPLRGDRSENFIAECDATIERAILDRVIGGQVIYENFTVLRVISPFSTESILRSIRGLLMTAGPMFSGNDLAGAGILANEWWMRGFSIDDVSEWISAGCFNYETAYMLRKNGFRPRRNALRYVAGRERDDMSAMYALCKYVVDRHSVCW